MVVAKTIKSVVMLAILAVALIGSDAESPLQREAVERGKTMQVVSAKHKHTNRLINESSPYLLQHAHNPVDWYPWGNEAFERAKKNDIPIFLSIGYSTCHWCHVMEQESFDNEWTARIMNEHFVSIKVDREQRPDVDAIYMNAVQMMTGSGGWPLSVFLTPEGKPFYGGTYFPPKDMYGRPGFDRVLLAIAEMWKNKRQELLNSAAKLSQVLKETSLQVGQETLSPDILNEAYSYLEKIFDSTYGGFGSAPKFPQASNLSMLLGYWYRTGNEKALAMVETTLDAMAKGGIYDHLGGGFHRYSTDTRWLVPHFEKMLYDQALLSRAYVQTYQVTGKTAYARIAREIFDYVLRDMTDTEGGFYSAEDADSEGKEGTFYVWHPGLIEQILGAEKAKIFNEHYGVTKTGNFEDGKSILNISKSVEQLAKQFKKDPSAIEDILAQGRSKLLQYRAKRPRPYRDDKIITSWNGLMISSMAYGGAVLQQARYVNAAGKAAEFVLAKLCKNGRLMRYYRKDKAVELGFLDDYAFMIMALLDLYEATFDVKWLVEARRLAEQMIELFCDEVGGGFFLTGKDTERLIVRNKPSYDGAVPSGNSVAALALLKLSRLTIQQRFTDQAKQVFETFSSQLVQSPASLSSMLIALDFWFGPTQEIVIAGEPQQTDTKEMLKLVRSNFLPNAIVLFHETGEAGQAIEKEVAFVKGQVVVDSRATAYLCENYVCKSPVNKTDDLRKILSDISRAK
ncbi:MAG: thioredoxin domain-containing protein [Sedimentisphaerales bacterium]